MVGQPVFQRRPPFSESGTHGSLSSQRPEVRGRTGRRRAVSAPGASREAALLSRLTRNREAAGVRESPGCVQLSFSISAVGNHSNHHVSTDSFVSCGGARFTASRSVQVVGWLIIQYATTVLPALTLRPGRRAGHRACSRRFSHCADSGVALDVGAGVSGSLPRRRRRGVPPALRAGKETFLRGHGGSAHLALIGYFVLSRSSAPRKLGKSIAVLPFANFSAHRERYFADGIQMTS